MVAVEACRGRGSFTFRASGFGARAALDRGLIRPSTRCCRIRRPSTRPAHDCWGAVVESVHSRGRPVTLPSR